MKTQPQRPLRPRLKGMLTQPFFLYGSMVSCYALNGRITPTGYFKLCSLSKDLGWVQVTEKLGKEAIAFILRSGLDCRHVASPFDLKDIAKPSYAFLDEPIEAVLTSKKTSKNGRVSCSVEFATLDEMLANRGEWDVVLAGLERASSVHGIASTVGRSMVA